jgi:4'-phosphopantetheinyl transferase
MSELDAEIGVGEVRVYTLQTGDREVTRAALRQIIARCLSLSTEVIQFEYGPKGKPTLQTDPSLHFSVSHAETVSMIAVTRVAPVGVDVEKIRSVPRAEAILRRFFPSEDVESILSDGNRDLHFVRAWTRAEATVKVRGASLWEAATPDPSVTTRDLIAPDGYAASVAVAAQQWHFTQVSL